KAMSAQSRFASPADDDELEQLIARLSNLSLLPDGQVVARSAEGAPAQCAFTAGDLSFLAPAEPPDEMGRLGGYRVLKVLGAGGMGIVFEADDHRLKRHVALKVMRPTLAVNAFNRRRFLREAQATAALEHDGVVAIYQVGEDRGVAFLAMPLLRGE